MQSRSFRLDVRIRRKVSTDFFGVYSEEVRQLSEGNCLRIVDPASA